MAVESHSTAMAFLQAGQTAEAERVYRAILQQNPRDAEAMLYLGIFASMAGRHQPAVELLNKANALRPDNLVILMNLGRASELAGEKQQALAAYRRVTEIQPQFPDALERVAELLLKDKDKKPAEAILFLQRLLPLSPDRPSVHNLLGTAVSQLGNYQESLGHFDRAIALDPGFAEAHYNRGVSCNNLGRLEEAFTSFDRAVELLPDLAHKLKAVLFVPEIMQSPELIARTRQRIYWHLTRLRSSTAQIPNPEENLDASPFFLAYHGENDRDVQEMLARLFRKAIPSLNHVAAHCARPRPPSSEGGAANRPIKIGFISRHFHNHTIGWLNAGLIQKLSRQLFQVFVLRFPDHDTDSQAKFISHSADVTVTLARELPAARQQIADLELDVLYYPDIGMYLNTYLLAFSRLAPVQCVSWGHPVTTGLTSIDYFLSSKDLEPDLPPGSQSHYTERLVKMEALTTYFYRPTLEPPMLTRADFGLENHHTLYVCPQTLFKIHPEFDDILAGILRADPRGRIVLIASAEAHKTRLLTQRFERNIPDVADRILFVGRQTPESYLHLLAVSDVMLDPIHFGGGKTSLEGFALGIPIVTLVGGFLRSRLTYAMYRMMGLDDGVVLTAAAYVEQAVRLGTDADYRQTVRGKILERNGILYENAAAVRELERFLVEAVKNSPASFEVDKLTR